MLGSKRQSFDKGTRDSNSVAHSFFPNLFLTFKNIFFCCCFKGKDFPGGLVAKTPCSQCKGPGFDP